MVARSSAVRSTPIRAGSSVGASEPSVPGQVDDDQPEAAREGGGVPGPGRPTAREPVDQQQRPPGPARADLPAEAVDELAAHGRIAAATTAATSRCNATFRERSVRSSRTCTPGVAIDRSICSRRSVRPTTDVLAAQRRHDRRHVDPMGRPEQLLVPVRQPRARDRGRPLRQEREDAAAVVVDEDDRRGQPVQLRGHERVQVVEERHVAHDERDRPAGHRRGARAPWRSRRRCRWRPGSTGS